MGELLASTLSQLSGLPFENAVPVFLTVRFSTENCRRTGLLATFALWWYMELLPENTLCENSNSFFRAVPRDFRTGDPTLDSDVVTCEGYMAYGTDLFGQEYNRTLCASNFTLLEHK
jgi:hypothetical protein